MQPAPSRTAPDPPVTAGQVQRRTLGQCPDMAYYLYAPTVIRVPERLFVSVHGISRNALEHAELFSSLAEDRGVVMIAPLFDRDGFRGYQRLAANRDGLRPDAVLDMIVSEVRGLLALPAVKLNLFGFSGGGQFAHRYLMACPQRVESAVLGAAGWYTFPSPGIRFPRGLKPAPDRHWRPAFPGFLQVPVTVVVGEHDNLRDQAFNKSRKIDRQQGHNRVERGRRWVAAMQQVARQLDIPTAYRFHVLPGVGHEFHQAMRHAGLGRLVFEHLFGTQSAIAGAVHEGGAGPALAVTRDPAG